MPTSSPQLANQLHIDRTARIQRGQRSLTVPALSRRAWFTRKERRLVVCPAPTC